jgi:hypothetical protein
LIRNAGLKPQELKEIQTDNMVHQLGIENAQMFPADIPVPILTMSSVGILVLRQNSVRRQELPDTIASLDPDDT